MYFRLCHHNQLSDPGVGGGKDRNSGQQWHGKKRETKWASAFKDE